MYQSPSHVTLSTYFLGSAEDGSGAPSTAYGNFMALRNVANRTRNNALNAITEESLAPEYWAACSDSLKDAPLPCRTGDFPARCVSGARHCGTAEENTHEPWLEMDLRGDRPTDRDYYLFGIEFTLPPESEYGALFFDSAQGISLDRGDTTNRYYTITVLDQYHNPLTTQCKPFFRQSVDVYADSLAHFQYVCLEALAEDAEYEAMRNVRYIRLTLNGDYRMIWLHSMRVIWRTLEELPPAGPPLTSPNPPPYPNPGAPPDAPSPSFAGACDAYPLLSFGNTFPLAFNEPCDLSFDECCALSYHHNTTATFTLSAAGCCALFEVSTLAERANLASAVLIPTTAFGFGTATSGVRTTATFSVE